MAKISLLPAATELTGDEHLPIVQGASTRRVTMSAFRDLITPFLQYWYRGDTGDTGPANSTYPTLLALKAASPSNLSFILASDAGPVTYAYVAGNFSAAHDELNVVELDAVPLTSGALVRQDAGAMTYRASADAFPASVGAVLSYTIDVRMFGAVFDGRDNTVALQKALNFARALGGSRTVVCPPGDCFLSSTVRVWSGVALVGAGSLNTRFRRTGDYGDTFIFGTDIDLGGGVIVTVYNSSGASGGFFVYQDHGTGMFPPNTVAGGFTNLVTHGAHMKIGRDFNVSYFDIVLVGMTYQIDRFGGLNAKHEAITTIGIYDQAVPAMQETLVGILIRGDLGAIPTDLDFINCRVGGITSPKRPITLPSGDVISDSVQNIGALYGIQVECAEGIRWRSGYIGACADSGVRLLADPNTILMAVSFVDMFVDSNGVAGLWIDRLKAGTPRDIT